MKAFKGCVNPECAVYKKKHYKNEDDYCTKCGEKLYYVCADCWKQLDTNKEKYCITCKAIRDDKKDQRAEKTKETVKKVGATFAATGPIIVAAAKNVQQIEKSGKTLVEAGGKIIKVITKK